MIRLIFRCLDIFYLLVMILYTDGDGDNTDTVVYVNRWCGREQQYDKLQIDCLSLF